MFPDGGACEGKRIWLHLFLWLFLCSGTFAYLFLWLLLCSGTFAYLFLWLLLCSGTYTDLSIWLFLSFFDSLFLSDCLSVYCLFVCFGTFVYLCIICPFVDKPPRCKLIKWGTVVTSHSCFFKKSKTLKRYKLNQLNINISASPRLFINK
jgi:hypothetical protein